MIIPQLPDDVFSEILGHFFFIDVEAYPPRRDVWGERRDRARGPTVIGQSTALLLVSRRFRTLVEPFIWRTIFIDRPSDFTLFFAPKTGLLKARGKEGDVRRGWVTELVLGRDAAVPFDKAKIAKERKRKRGLDEGTTYDLHVRLLPTKLPNLRRVTLSQTAYLAPFVVENDPSYASLCQLIDDASGFSKSEAEDSSGYLFEDLLVETYSWLWTSLAHQNDALIADFLAPWASNLVVLRAPFELNFGWSDDASYIQGMDGTLTSRLPATLKEANGLRVILRRPDQNGIQLFWIESVKPTLDQTRQLAQMLPADARVEVHMPKAKVVNDGEPVVRASAPPAGERGMGEWANWTRVDENGTKSPFRADLLRVSSNPISQSTPERCRADALISTGRLNAVLPPPSSGPLSSTLPFISASPEVSKLGSRRSHLPPV